ncbi:alpha/beta fold hydrolase [Micrococcoides hystricis]|uniref:Alpha/beta fold hydrolase n=1 Tax=Micrococcoides hystricis TaxID=1572761 RepID=A0ABV6PCH4_9MICC
MSDPELVLFLHGLGDSPASWDAVIENLPAGMQGIALNVPGLSLEQDLESAPFELHRAAAHVRKELDSLGVAQTHLCGLSLGAMVALQTAIDSPQRLRTLTLVAGQVKPPRWLMTLQSTLVRMLPAKVFGKDGPNKTQILAALKAAKTVDFSTSLSDVRIPTLVLCGSRDRPNLPAARRLATEIPDARLRIIPDGGHTLNQSSPALIAKELGSFIAG